MPTPDGPQFIHMLHASLSPDAPHLDTSYSNPEKYSNSHPDIMHMGTARTVDDAFLSNRPYVHKYRVPVSHVYPAVFGDEKELIDSEERQIVGYGAEPHETSFGRAMTGIQEGLFEQTPATPEFVLRNNVVVPYRNRLEGKGEISYMVPKSLFPRSSGDKDSPIEYLGVEHRS